MKLYKLFIPMVVVHLLAGGIGSIIVINLVSSTGLATYGGERGFLPGEDSPYSAFGRFLYGDERPSPTLPGEDSGGLGLAKYGVTDGICFISTTVRQGLVITTFAYPVIDIIPMEGFGLWIRMAIHLASLALTGALMYLLVEMLIQMGVFSNVYVLIAVGVISSAGLVSTILAQATEISC